MKTISCFSPNDDRSFIGSGRRKRAERMRVAGAGTLRTSRKEELAGVCEGCGPTLAMYRYGFSIDFRRLLVCGAGGNCFCSAIRRDTAKHYYPPNHAPDELTDLADQRARVASLASASSLCAEHVQQLKGESPCPTRW